MSVENNALLKEIQAANQQWLDALRVNSQEVAKLYANLEQDGFEAVLLPTVLGKVCDTAETRKAYFDHFCEKDPIGTIVEPAVQLLSPVPGHRVVNYMGHYDFALKQEDGTRVTVPARFTFTYVETPRGWVIGHHHSSAMPATREFAHRPTPKAPAAPDLRK